jgi:hypothetical protein
MAERPDVPAETVAALDSLANAGHPFFKPVWFPDIVGMALEDDVDRGEVAELVTESYCALAPRRSAELVQRGHGG